MAAGKSTIGRALADRLGFDLVDTDTVIEERMGKPLAEVVAPIRNLKRSFLRQ